VIDKLKIRILALDDDALMLKIIRTLLTQLGYASIDLCDNGVDALAILGQGAAQPQVILLDISMPGMDGIEFIRHLVDYHYSGAIILVSGEDLRVLQSIQTLLAAHHLHCIGILMKPINRAAMQDIFETWSTSVPSQEAAPLSKVRPETLRAAIADGELINYYQPKVNLQTGAVVGFETLIRWHSPSEGLLLPDQFISVAEEFDMVNEMTLQVLQSALKQAREWQDAGYSWRVAVNISMKNLGSLCFLDQIMSLTLAAGLEPQMLELEVTESYRAEDLRIPLEILTRLHINRFRLSIDDFGTGNSSLSQLTAIPFDELKIDQRFVHGAHIDATRCAAFDASLGLAKQLHMEAVAEGVEDRADWDFLKDKACDVAQGYFISKALPVGEIPSWLLSWEARRPELCQSAQVVH